MGAALSRFIARSREASTEHSFNQTVTSPPGAARRLENRSLLGSLPRLRFCSHAPRLSSERCAGSDGTFFFFFLIQARVAGVKKTSAITTTFYRRPDIKQNISISSLLLVRHVQIDLLLGESGPVILLTCSPSATCTVLPRGPHRLAKRTNIRLIA